VNANVRLRILKKVSVSGSIAFRVAITQASRCPWPLLARRYYLQRAEAKLSYLLPLVIGVQVAGLRITNMQSRWALAAITGRASWPKTLRVPRDIRQILFADLGWRCLWTAAKSAAVTLYEKCRCDESCFAHTRLCNEVSLHAKGGWFASARRIQSLLRIPPWCPDDPVTAVARKASLAKYRREIIGPIVSTTSPSASGNPPLPWAWLALRVGHDFPADAVELWWQVRALGQPYPKRACPLCTDSSAFTRTHLERDCMPFAEWCWTSGVRPEEVFSYPTSEEWFQAVLQTMARVTRIVTS
jgi:hypothetical protein